MSWGRGNCSTQRGLKHKKSDYTMVDIKRLRKLKKQQLRMVSSFEREDPLSLLNPNYVSTTGLTADDIADKIDKLRECATIIELVDNFVQVGDTYEQVLNVSAANYCKQHSVCPICASRMQQRRKAKLSDPIRIQAELCNESFTDEYGVERKKRYAYMVTYTVADGKSLSERLEHLKISKKNFRKMGQRRKGKCNRSAGEFGKIVAGASTIEIKRGERSGDWHVHCHDLVFTDERLDYRIYNPDEKRRLHKKYGKRIPDDLLHAISLRRSFFNGRHVPVSKISDEWLRATGGDSIDIGVNPIQHVPEKAKGKKRRMYKKMSLVESILYQSKECMKYPYKPNDLCVADAMEVMVDTYNKRMTATYGAFYGIPGDDYNDDLDDTDHFVMQWNGSGYDLPQPGTVRRVEDAKSTRVAVGVALGDYRRDRRVLIDRYTTRGLLTLCTHCSMTVKTSSGRRRGLSGKNTTMTKNGERTAKTPSVTVILRHCLSQDSIFRE